MSDSREALALEWAWAKQALDEAEAEVDRLSAIVNAAAHGLRDCLAVGEAVAAGPHGWVALVPPKRRLPARVNPSALVEFREELLGVGLVREETVLTRPKVSEVRDKAAALAAHGVPIDRVLVEPVGQPELEVVPRDGGADA